MHLSSSGPATNIRTPSQLHFRRASKSSAERQKAQRRATPEGDRGSREPSSAPTQHTTPTHRVRCSLHQLHCIQKYERERERERECVCVCVCERERERERERFLLSLLSISLPLCASDTQRCTKSPTHSPEQRVAGQKELHRDGSRLRRPALVRPHQLLHRHRRVHCQRPPEPFQRQSSTATPPVTGPPP